MSARTLAGDRAAFPQPFSEAAGPIHPDFGGLTKRELIAAMAMQGALAGTAGGHLSPPNLYQEAVRHADGLLQELAK